MSSIRWLNNYKGEEEMVFRIKTFGVVAACVASLFALYACGGGGGGGTTPVSVTSNAYQGAGSAWSLTSKSDGTCTLSESNSNLQVNATCSKLSSGFTKITVTSATGGNVNLVAPAAGTVTWAYEIAGYMMPFIGFTVDKVVPTVSTGTCALSVNHNFVVSFGKLDPNQLVTSFNGWSHMGNYTINNVNGLTINGYAANGTQIMTNQNIPSFTLAGCTNGLKTDTDANNAKSSLYLTQNGGAIFHQDRSASTATTGSQGSVENDFMLPASNDVTSLAGLDGNYIGFVITSQGAGNYATKKVAVTASNGAFAVSDLTGTDLTTSTPGHSNFTLTTKVSTSLYRGSLTHTNAGGSIGCAINATSGQKIVICSGLDPADGTNKTLYSAILKSS